MLDIFQNAVSNTLRAMSTGLKYPVMILLVLLAAYTLFLVGTFVAEIFQEHRHLKVEMPAVVDEIRAAGHGRVAGCIEDSQLLKRQKAALIELTEHPKLTDLMRESLAIRLIAQEKDFYARRTKQTDMVAKIGPMLGLMGTLIPLGPGIIALGQGDTYTLSTSLLTAFDTTVAGLACAAVALLLSSIRKRWYANYMSMLETLMECVLEVENGTPAPTDEESEEQEEKAPPQFSAETISAYAPKATETDEEPQQEKELQQEEKPQPETDSEYSDLKERIISVYKEAYIAAKGEGKTAEEAEAAAKAAAVKAREDYEK